MICEDFESRLIAGEQPTRDPALAAHVGSCLRCFRTAADMRDVPRLAVLLRDGERAGAAAFDPPAAFDPGAGFWESFPRQVAAAWVSTRAGHRQGDPVASPGATPLAPRSLWQWASRLVRQPLPAALAGAVCAVSVVLVVMQQPGPLGSGDDPGPGHAAPADFSAELRATGVTGGYQAHDVLEGLADELDVEGLSTLRNELHRALGPSGRGGAPADPDVVSATASSDPSRVAEDLEMLDETGLIALRDNLGDRF
jgi:hypothetical protein